MYAKLFTSIYQGTLRGNSTGLLVFTNLLAHADKDGIADIHPRAIAEEVGLPVEAVRAALAVLESPDDESRSPEEQGRRIIRVDEHRAWGWKIVNYAKYRAIRSEEDRREQNRLAQEKWRAKQVSQRKPSKATVSHGKPEKAHTEAEAEAKKEIPPTPKGVADMPGFARFWSTWPSNDRKGGKAKCLTIWKRHHLEADAERIVAHLEAMKTSPKWREAGGEFVPMPSTYLNGRRWDGAEIASGVDAGAAMFAGAV